MIICDAISARASLYVNNSLTQEEVEEVNSHLRTCGNCQNTFRRVQAVHGLLESMPPESPAERESTAVEPFLSGWTRPLSVAPWWGVSVALHVLVIALAGLISMSIELPKGEDAVVIVTELQPKPQITEAEPAKDKPKLSDALASKHETPPTDPASKELSDIVVPPDILAKAELGDHWETINPDRPDTHSAFGNPDSHMFYSEKGCDEPEGGGGNGGVGLDDVIGIGGVSSPGTGGGWGGGHGTGIGVGNGSGRGSFGNRNGGGRRLMVKRHGGSAATENAVDKALEWLAKHQEADGHWDVVKYSGSHGGDSANTGFALLAFLGAGHTEKVGKYRDNVRRAVEWLRSKQKDDGCYASGGESTGYNHAIPGLAMAEAAGMARIPETVKSAQKAVDYSCEKHQAGEGSDKLGWRYSPKSAGDISHVGWFVMQLKSAKVAGLSVPPASFEGAAKFLDSVEDKKFGASPSNPYDNGRHRYGYVDNKREEIMTRPMRTAIGCLCRQFMGAPKEELAGAVEWFMNTPGNRGGGLPCKDKTNLYYWYYGSLCTFQQGGDLWKKWNEALKPVLLDTQRKGGDEDGSWDPEQTPGAGNAWGSMWGRVGQTALSALCLEVYYRYQKLDGN